MARYHCTYDKLFAFDFPNPNEELELVFEDDERAQGVVCNFGIFAFGEIAIAFVNSHLYDDEATVIARAKVCSVVGEKCKVTGKDDPENREVFRLIVNADQSVLFCEIEQYLPRQFSLTVCHYCMQHFAARASVVVLTVLHINDFVDDNGESSYERRIFRCVPTVRSQGYEVELGCPFLTTPNVVCNFPAVVMRTVADRRAILYLCYTQYNDVTVENFSIFEEFLKYRVFREMRLNLDADERFFKFVAKLGRMLRFPSTSSRRSSDFQL